MFREKFLQILQMLGFVEKANQKQLSDADWKAIDSEFTKKFGMSIADALAENKANESMLADRNAALEIINASESDDDDDDDDNDDNDDNDDEPDKKANSLEKKVATIIANSEKQVATITALQSKIDKMAKIATPDTPASVVTRQITAFGGLTTKNHLFGIENSFFDMNKRWNQIAENKHVASMKPHTDEEAAAFETETRQYGASLAKRYAFLQDKKLLNAVKAGTFTNDLGDLSGAGLGDQYVTLRQDALIARILEIPTVYEFFPRRYGIQDRELMTIAYFEELSQAYQPGHVFKGGMKLQPEMGYTDKSMFKTEFGPMDEIETQYIAYLNTDGSDPMKWSMIEWQLLNMYKVLTNEQNTRVIRGCYVKPETGVAGSYLNAGTGLLYTLQRYMHENKLLPHSDVAYNSYDESSMLDAVNAFLDDIILVLDEDESIEDKFIYLNKRHQSWWKKAIRAQFGKDTDFTGTDSFLNVVPDYGIRIKWLPNLGTNNKMMLIQEHGNLQALEFIAGEMLAVKFDKAMELMHVWSTWREGFSAFIVGKPYNTLEELKANKYSMQTIFMNKPLTLIAPDATTVDGKLNYWYGTGKNTQATAITEITDAKVGVVYIIECEDATFPSSIAKAGKFADIQSAYTPTKVGDYIMVVLNKAGNFIELERRVAGVRTINKEAQPNIIGGR